jgi:hypothetical protein
VSSITKQSTTGLAIIVIVGRFNVVPALLNVKASLDALNTVHTVLDTATYSVDGSRGTTQSPMKVVAGSVCSHKSPGLLCAVDTSREGCRLDMGGPLFSVQRDDSFVLTGVSTTDANCYAEPQEPSTFISVRAHGNWIKSAAGQGNVGIPRLTPPYDSRRSPRKFTGLVKTSVSNVGALVSANEPYVAVGTEDGGTKPWLPQYTIWYAWRAPASGGFSLTTAGSAIDTTVNVFELTRGTFVGGNDDCNTRDVTSCVRWLAQSGRDYLFQLGGYDTMAQGRINVTISR